MGWGFVFEDPDPDVYAFDGMDRSRIQPYEHAMPGIVNAARAVEAARAHPKRK